MLSSYALTFSLGILSTISPPSATQIQAVLLELIKPAFERARPNENLNMTTATKVKRGTSANLSYYDDTNSDWKNNLGLVDILLWCLTCLQVSLQLLIPFTAKSYFSGSRLGVPLALSHTACSHLHG